MSKFGILCAATLALALCIGSLIGAGLWCVVLKSDCAADCCGRAEPKGPKAPARRDALELHRWYRTSQAVGWSYDRREWSPGAKKGVIQAGTPLYVVERRGSVAVLRGAVHGVVLVPDGPSTQYFRGIGTGEIGENDFGELPADP